ncbi:hypothetical protein HOP62_10940 [Halomonas sp. MCCC 1A17488]|uniref:DUF883 domain-containing protein n=1 Tax=Billgrantia sulfidoxydans TaxID=2733484 RepID=A0ABX7W0L7_9GAMM|nr:MULTISPECIES: hypothetical protein [Halomonas]MCE8016585.1 hypothetical protein [Halomonas sp. MCCC 1A17488]MCG3239918.1 hypothetical protein [Halomonas sp. MCCC 1A17488]QPP50189.1 hypothetical protein I4484_03430 [Halomonas sp. SS10-MC5]QTP53808.1 hypothetical protein HNO51_03405 [Halomonas sulfidoxydans]
MSDTDSRASREAGVGNDSDRHGLDREEIRQQAEETRDELRDAARQQAEGLLDRQKAAAADQAERVSTVLHKMADEFERQEQPYFSGCVNELARRSDAFSRNLRERDLEALMEQTRHYTRQHPALFMGGAIAAGFMLSRFMRSSSQSDASTH